MAHIARGALDDALALLEPTIGVEIDLRYERFAMPGIRSAIARGWLSVVLSELGRFDGAIVHGEAAVQIAEEAGSQPWSQPWTLYNALYSLALAHFRRGELARATLELERTLDLCRTWGIVVGTSIVAATLGAAYALGGRTDEALPMVAEAVKDFRRRQMHIRPAYILLYAATSYFLAGRMDEAVSHTRDALALTRRLGARASEAHALCLAGDIASTRGAGDAEGQYHEALTLASERGMRPFVAHCHLGLGKLYRRTGKREQAREPLAIATTLYREMGMGFYLALADAEISELAR
jgi:tetratricopeptide (TPR) repeat protein